MKSILEKFADNVLSKNEMKALKGGGNCAVCSTWPGSGVFNCGSNVFSWDEASEMASEFDTTLDDGYSYAWSCN